MTKYKTTILCLCTALFFFLGGVPLSLAQTSGTKTGSIKKAIADLKKEVSQLKTAAAMTPTLAQAVQDTSSKIVLLEQKLEESQAHHQSVQSSIEQLDALALKVRDQQREVEYLRTNIANIEQPAVSFNGVGHSTSGMNWVTPDGNYSLSLGGFMQTRYQSVFSKDFSTLDSAGFRLKRGRLNISGKLGGKRLRYHLSLSGVSTTPLMDYYMDMKYSSELKVRVGQAKVPYTRSALASSTRRIFPEFSKSQNMQRYNRDIGVWAMGQLWDGKLRYHGGISNGSGRNRQNENIDFATALRIDGSLLGEPIPYGFGDVKGTEKAAITVGLALVHDLVTVPGRVSGVEVNVRDVDGDGVLDNIRVLSMAADMQFRLKGLEVFLEGTWRHEQWGTIVDHDGNAPLRSLLNPSRSGRRNYLSITGQASYFVIPHRLLLGTRISHGRLPVLGLGGEGFAAAPIGPRAMQIDAIVQLYRDGVRRVGFSYGLLNYNALEGDEPENDIGHIFVLEAQVLL